MDYFLRSSLLSKSLFAIFQTLLQCHTFCRKAISEHPISPIKTEMSSLTCTLAWLLAWSIVLVGKVIRIKLSVNLRQSSPYALNIRGIRTGRQKRLKTTAHFFGGADYGGQSCRL